MGGAAGCCRLHFNAALPLTNPRAYTHANTHVRTHACRGSKHVVTLHLPDMDEATSLQLLVRPLGTAAPTATAAPQGRVQQQKGWMSQLTGALKTGVAAVAGSQPLDWGLQHVEVLHHASGATTHFVAGAWGRVGGAAACARGCQARPWCCCMVHLLLRC